MILHFALNSSLLLLAGKKRVARPASLSGTTGQKKPSDVPAVELATSSVRMLPAVNLGFLFKEDAITSNDHYGDRLGV